MISSIFTTLLANPGYLSLGALVLSTFFAGSMLQGDRVRTQEIKEELREIQQLTEQSLAQVEQIQVKLEQEDARLVNEISQAYEILAVLNEKEREVRVGLKETEKENNRLAAERRKRQEEIRKNGSLVFSN